MIDHAQTDGLRSQDDGARDQLVVLTGFQLAAGMVVRQHDGRRLPSQRRLDHAARVYRGTVDRALLEDLDAVREERAGGIEVRHAEYLVLQAADPHAPEVAQPLRVGDHFACFGGLLQVERGGGPDHLQSNRGNFAHSRDRLQLGHRRIQNAAHVAEAT